MILVSLAYEIENKISDLELYTRYLGYDCNAGLFYL
ncbi:hypothetical protein SAMN05444267_1012107 [Chryseobacterium polytrichastri]|uniref:Uncharacterized protein n=1 Tax=Chryseobacterium polytrichastri TaxID=1302687 RepID=A0A1M6Y744_9FLAO|nr:hypothetical protein SAMN05444267_1012107 [Chryseobacterium polytrichastri]